LWQKRSGGKRKNTLECLPSLTSRERVDGVQRFAFPSAEREKTSRRPQERMIRESNQMRKKEEGRRMKEEGRRKKEEGRRKENEGRKERRQTCWTSGSISRAYILARIALSLERVSRS